MSTINGTANNDTLTGTSLADTIYGGAGNDTLIGGEGNDTLVGGVGSDSLYGGGDNDLLIGGGSSDAGGTAVPATGSGALNSVGIGTYPTLNFAGVAVTNDSGPVEVNSTYDTSYNPAFYNTNYIDINEGHTGSETLTFTYDVPREGFSFHATAADPENVGDTIIAKVNVTLTDGSVVTLDVIDTSGAGGLGAPFSYTAPAGLGVASWTIKTELVDSNGPDTGDWLHLHDGGAYGFSGAASASLDTDTSGDLLDGGLGLDTLYGGAGNDTLIGGEANDTLYGGADNDALTIGAGDHAQGGTGNDTFTLDDTLTGNAAITVIGGENTGDNDVLDLRGLDDVDVIYGGGNNEAGTANYTNAAGDTVNITFSEIESVLTDTIVLDGIVDGTSGNELIDGSYTGDLDGDRVDNNDAILGNVGSNDDVIFGHGGNDTIFGGSGNDTIYGDTDSADRGIPSDVPVDPGTGTGAFKTGNQTPIYNQLDPEIITLSNGNTVVVFETWNTDPALSGTSADIRAQVYNSFGEKVGSEIVVSNDAAWNVVNREATVTEFGDGGFIVGWAHSDYSPGQSGTFNPQYKIYDASGQAVGGTVSVSNGDTDAFGYANPELTTLDDGRVVMVYDHYNDVGASGTVDDRSGIFGRIIEADGTYGDEFQINTTTYWEQVSANVQSLDGGGFVAVYKSVSGADNTILGQVFDSNGNKVGVEFRVPNGNDVTTSVNDPPEIVALDDGGFMVAFGGTVYNSPNTDGQTISGGGTSFRFYNADGTPRGESTQITGSKANESAAVQLADGSIVITYLTTAPAGSGGTLDVSAIILDTDGNVLKAPFVLITDIEDSPGGNSGIPQMPSLTALPDGSFAIAYQDLSVMGYANGGYDVFVARFDAEGNPIENGINSEVGGFVDSGVAGSDDLYGGIGDDAIFGGAGNDTLIGGEGNDSLFGGDGDDALTAGAGDNAQGGIGNDIFTIDDTLTGTAAITVIGGENTGDNDVLDLRGLDDVDVIYGGGDNEAGTATYTNAAGQTVTITFSEIETVLTDPVSPDGIVDGTAGDDVMTPTSGAGGTPFTDAQGDQIDGTDGLNDTIYGNGGNDSIDAGTGNDLVYGGDDNDTVLGGAGDDTLHGDAGNDSLGGGTGNDVIYGGAGSDTLAGGSGTDTLYGGDGDDNIAVGGGDLAYGGSGDDVFTLDGSDPAADINATIVGGETGEDLSDPTNGGAGDALDLSDQTHDLTVDLGTNPESGTVDGLDTIAGDDDITFSEIENILTGLGDDTINGAAATGPVNVDTGAGNDSITTGSGNDSIAAGTGDDVVDGGAGDDSIDAGAGDDSVLGGDGNDTVDAGAGNDTVDGGAGDDSVLGGAGNDVLIGGLGDDTLDGGDDADSLSGGDGNDSLIGGAGNDTLLGGAGSDTLIGGEGADTLNGGDGDDDIVIGAGDAAFGGSGDDVFTVDPNLTGTAGITVVGGETGEDLTDPSNNPGGRIGDVLDLRGLESVVVTPDFPGAESGTATYLNAANETVTITYSEIEHVLFDIGGPVDGTAGDDIMTPTSGAGGTPFTDAQGDQVDGADGLNDTIYGYGGNDSIDGGAGDDLVYGGADNDTMTGGAGNDTLYGDAGNDVIHAGAGNDTLIGGAGEDSLDGGDGDDLLFGDAGNDTLSGGAGDDTLYGGEGDDSLDGGDGDDLLFIGAGDGALGGLGSDIFRVDDTLAGNTPIVVIGGENTGDNDVLDLRGLDDVNVTYGGGNNEAGTATYTNGAGQTVTINFSEIETVLLGPTADGIVDGTAGDDVMTPTSGPGGTPYTDTQGDQVDGTDGLNDTIYGYGGNDSIDGGAGNDLVYGGADNDTVSGGAGNDTIYGDAGNDSIRGDEGDDLVFGGDGADTIRADNGDDTVYGGLGNDSIFGFTGSDLVYGDEGDDYINTRAETGVGVPDRGYPGLYPGDTDIFNDRDTVYGGTGNDTILTGDDNDLVFGGIGNDSIDGGFDDDTLHGDAGDDTILGGEGRDIVYGGDGNDLIFGGQPPGDNDALNLTDDIDLVTDNNIDTLYGGAGDDTIFGMDDADILYGDAGADLLYGGIDNDSLYGGDGNDTLLGEHGEDALFGGIGNDSLDGGIGNDTLDGGTGNNTLTGGAGDDVFVWDGTSNLVVTDWQSGISGPVNDNNQANNDFINLTTWYNTTTLTAVNGVGGNFGSAIDMLRADAADGVIDGIINGTNYAAQIGIPGSLQLQGATPSNLTEDTTGVVCFVSGTRIMTQDGEVVIDQLQQGDLVMTMDHGFQPIRWIGSTIVTGKGKLAPILFKAGAMTNTRDLRVSPQHRMFLSGWQAEMLFGEDEVLAAAKYLVNDHTILRQECAEVEYFHILFDTHEIVFAEGCPSESFHPGRNGWGDLTDDLRQEILTLFPELEDENFAAYGESARTTLKAHEAHVLASYASPHYIG